jgi:hypothetical protein
MAHSSTGIKLCKCGHGKSIHSGVFQRKQTGPSKCNYPECRCANYRPVSGASRKAKRKG